MTLEELKEILGENTLSYSKVSLAELANIMPIVEVNLEMDKHSLDYYYQIDVNELLESKMTKEEVEMLKEQGWSFDDDKTKIILFLKNN